jgi:hypothetical protein
MTPLHPYLVLELTRLTVADRVTDATRHLPVPAPATPARSITSTLLGHLHLAPRRLRGARPPITCAGVESQPAC